MTFPSQEELKRVREKLEKVEGTLLPSKNPTPLEQFRWDICQKFLLYKMENNLTQKAIAIKVGVDEAKVSKILHHRIKEFSTDRLINLFSKLDENLQLKVS